MMYITLVFWLFYLQITSGISLSTFAQWRGPNRDGIYPENDLLKSWPENGPELLWTCEGIGDGYSSVSVSGGMVYATGKKDSIEYLSAINSSGNMIWQVPYGLAGRQSFPETRCTPTIENNRAWMISGRGEVVCLNLENHEVLWKVDGYRSFHGAAATWEIAESPLIVGNKIIYTPGGEKTSLVALDKNTGETVWQSGSLHDSTAYVSPIVFERGGVKIIAGILRNYLLGIDASNGEILWKFKYGSFKNPTWHPEAPFINCITPIYHDGRLFITSGYDHTACLFEVTPDGKNITLVWDQPVLDTHHGGVVRVDGYLYGSNWISNSQGNWVCVDWNTGEVMYEKEWETKGSIIAADGMLYVYDERRGNVGLVKPDPGDLHLVSSFRNSHGTGPHWAHPVIHGGLLYIRHGKTIAVYKIRKDPKG